MWNDTDRRRKEALWQIAAPGATLSAALIHVMGSISEKCMVNHGKKYLLRYKRTMSQEIFSSSFVSSIRFLGVCNMTN